MSNSNALSRFISDIDDDDEPGASTYLDDVAQFLYEYDLREDIPGIQNIIT